MDAYKGWLSEQQLSHLLYSKIFNYGKAKEIRNVTIYNIQWVVALFITITFASCYLLWMKLIYGITNLTEIVFISFHS